MPNPVLIPEPFAQSGDKNPIPLERAIADPIYRASWKAGFPPDTRLPKDLGGEAPDGLDFNGVLNIISQAVVFLQKGNAYQFDASLAPYPIGALVRSNDNLTTYQSTVPNNSNNPNSNMTGWRVYNSSSFVVDNLTTNDSAKALSAAQGKVLQDNKLESNKVGAANGVASLGANTKVPVSQLPAATILDAGVLRFATATEVANKTNVSAAVTPANVAAMIEQFPTVRASVKSGSDGGVFGGIGFSSVVRLGTGYFEFTLSSPAPNTNYIVMLTSSWGGNLGAASVSLDPNFAQTTTKFRVVCYWGGDNTNGSFNPVTLNAIVIY